MKKLTNLQYASLINKTCEKGKHKLRLNKFGIVWCTRCGKLFTGDINAEPLSEDDKLCVVEEKTMKPC